MTSGRRGKLSIVIPVYNEDQTVGQVIKKVRAANVGGLKKEIIIVNDGSTDRTKEKIFRLYRNKGDLKIYNSLINLGKGAAVRIGLTKCTGDIIIIQDADLELNPNEYKRIIEPILDGRTTVVYGSRFKGGKNPAIKLKTRMANMFLTTLTNILFGCHLTDMETAYKAFRREVLGGIRLRALEFDFEPEITAKIRRKGIQIYEVPVGYDPRSPEAGKHIKFKDGLEAIVMLFRCRFTG